MNAATHLQMEKNKNAVNSLKKVGHVSDAHGIRGDLYVVLLSQDNSWVQAIKEITFKSGTSSAAINLPIKKIKPFKKGFICSFANLTTRNQAEELKKYEVWVSEQLFVSDDGEQPFLSEILGFEMYDQHLGFIGRVIDFSTNGNQDLIILDQKVNNQNIEIPFVKEFILTVDYQLKKITTNLPDGLITINEKD